MKNLFFGISMENVLIFVCFFLGRFLSPHYVFNWAGFSAWLCMPSVWRLNYAPCCACREMSQRLSRALSNCGKSKLAWRSAGICHISNLKLVMKKTFFIKQKPFFFSSKIRIADTKNPFFSHNKTFSQKLKPFKKPLVENRSWQPGLFKLYDRLGSHMTLAYLHISDKLHNRYSHNCMVPICSIDFDVWIIHTVCLVRTKCSRNFLDTVVQNLSNKEIEKVHWQYAIYWPT